MAALQKEGRGKDQEHRRKSEKGVPLTSIVWKKERNQRAVNRAYSSVAWLHQLDPSTPTLFLEEQGDVVKISTTNATFWTCIFAESFWKLISEIIRSPWKKRTCISYCLVLSVSGRGLEAEWKRYYQALSFQYFILHPLTFTPVWHKCDFKYLRHGFRQSQISRLLQQKKQKKNVPPLEITSDLLCLRANPHTL